MSFLSAALLLFLVMDPFGNIPFFLCVLEHIPEQRRQKVLLRELLIALLVLVAFLLVGPFFMEALQISESSLHISGGIILFLIALRMIFGRTEEMVHGIPGGEPLIVPLAVPSVAGPSAMATVVLLMGQEPDRWPEWSLALFLAWLAAATLLFFSGQLASLLGKRVLSALERLMGLILTTLSVEMFLRGIRLLLQ